MKGDSGMKSKILVVTNHSYMLYRFRKELIEKLLIEYEVVLSMPFVGHEDDFKAMGCRCIETNIDRRGMNPIKDLKLMHFYNQLIKKEKPEKVITYSIKPNVYMGMVCRLKSIPYFANVQGLGTAFQNKKLAKMVTFMYKTSLKKAKKVFFENEANANEFLKRNIIKEDKIKILAGAGINLEHYTYSPYPKDEVKHFLYLGRIMKEKGMDEFFYAVKKLKEEYKDQVVFDVVGFFEDEYKEQVEQLQQDKIIEFHGFQSNPVPFYEKAHCVVLPSYHEGMSNVLLEAASIGRVVITSNIPGCKETLIDGKTGLLCNVKDAQSLYEKMHDIMEQSNETLEQMGKDARNYMIEKFDKKKVVSDTYKELMK